MRERKQWEEKKKNMEPKKHGQEYGYNTATRIISKKL